jgi:hypothetical protein
VARCSNDENFARARGRFELHKRSSSCELAWRTGQHYCNSGHSVACSP